MKCAVAVRNFACSHYYHALSSASELMQKYLNHPTGPTLMCMSTDPRLRYHFPLESQGRRSDYRKCCRVYVEVMVESFHFVVMSLSTGLGAEWY